MRYTPAASLRSLRATLNENEVETSGVEPRSVGREAESALEKRSRRHPPTSVVLATTLVAYVGLAFGYATLTPIWQNPDEPAHYNYVAFVALTGGLPTLQPGDWDAALLERLKNGTLQPGDSVAAIRYESWQPPLFYLAAAPLFRLGPLDDPAGLVFRLRAFDAGLGALTLGIAYQVARELLPWHLAVGVPLTMVGIPMFTAVSTAISADPLANLLAASVLLALVRRLRRPTDGPRWSIGAGALLGLGLLTKLALAIFVPLALLIVVLRSRRPVRECGLLLGATTVVVFPWMVHQVMAYGWADLLATGRHAAVVLDQPRFPGLSLSYLVAFFTITFHSFWAQFGWMAIVAPPKLYWVYGSLVVVAFGGLVLERRRLCGEAAWRLVAATFGTAVLAYVAYNLTFEQPQGRYLFTALVPIAALLILGWSAWMPRRVQAWGIVLVGAGLVGLNAYALIRVLVLGFAPAG